MFRGVQVFSATRGPGLEASDFGPPPEPQQGEAKNNPAKRENVKALLVS